MMKNINTYTKQATLLVEKEEKANNNLTSIIFSIVENLTLTRVTALLLNEESLKTNKQFNEYVTRSVYNIQGDIKDSPIKSALYKKLKAVDMVTKYVLNNTPATYQNESLYTQTIKDFLQPFASLNKLLESNKKEKAPIPAEESNNPIITQESLSNLQQLANPLEALQVASNTIRLHFLDTLESAPQEATKIIVELVEFLNNHVTIFVDGAEVTSQKEESTAQPDTIIAFENNRPVLATVA